MSDCSGKAQKQLYSKLQPRPLIRERVLISRNRQSSDRKQKSGHGTQMGIIHPSVFYLKLNLTLQVCPYLTGSTIHLRSAARNSDHLTTEAIYFLLHNIYKFSSYLTGSAIHLRSVARNSDHLTTEAVYFRLHNIYKFSSFLTGNRIRLRCVARNSDH
jgi:hypothetical protein